MVESESKKSIFRKSKKLQLSVNGNNKPLTK